VHLLHGLLVIGAAAAGGGWVLQVPEEVNRICCGLEVCRQLCQEQAAPTSSWPRVAAQCSGWSPWLSCRVRFAPASSSRLSVGVWLPTAARWSGVTMKPSPASRSTRLPIRYCNRQQNRQTQSNSPITRVRRGCALLRVPTHLDRNSARQDTGAPGHPLMWDAAVCLNMKYMTGVESCGTLAAHATTCMQANSSSKSTPLTGRCAP
jgi:hypothetical protein